MSAVWTHRFRSGLTILGIVIGITTVVTVASLLTGLRAGIVTFFDELGPDNVFISKNSGNPRRPAGTVKRSASAGRSLPEYADVIRRFSSTVEDIALSLVHSARFRAAASSPRKCRDMTPTSLSIVGASPNCDRSHAPRFRSGPLLHRRREQPRREGCGARLRHCPRALSRMANAVDRTFMMDGAEYTVVGVFEKAKGGFLGQNGQDTEVDIPAEDRRLALSAGGPLHDHRQSKAGHAQGRLRRYRGHHAPHPARDRPANRTISACKRPIRSCSSSIRSPA